ncbi:MAG: cation:proton antiporter [Deltaproteobacteria bacterium]|nr:cation:proton antiporter [Deltaproteobacteria bacterium]
MIRDLAILAALLGLVWFVNGVNLGYEFALGDQGALAFGFILLASFIIGGMTRHLKMPRITGYLIAGLIFGPSILGRLVPVLGILTPEVVRELSIFNSIALGLIAFSAGGELKIEALRPRAGAIARLTVWRIVLLFFGTAALVIACGGLLPWPGGGGIGTTAGMAILFGAAALAKSPASTIALIIEYEAKGPMTTTVLGTTLLGDVVILIMFSVAMIAAKILLVAGATADIAFAGLIVWEVIGSLAIGTALGYLLAQYMTYVGREMPIILVALSFLALELAREMHLSGMLICLAAGFYVENFTGKGDRLIQAIDRYSLPLFVLFFTIAGAGLDLSVLAGMWPVVLFLVLTRLVLTWLSAWLGRRGDPELDLPGRTMWTGFVTQAGVTLGIAELIGREIPGIGPEIKTIIVAGIAVNQIIGPIAFRYGLLPFGRGHRFGLK